MKGFPQSSLRSFGIFFVFEPLCFCLRTLRTALGNPLYWFFTFPWSGFSFFSFPVSASSPPLPSSPPSLTGGTTGSTFQLKIRSRRPPFSLSSHGLKGTALPVSVTSFPIPGISFFPEAHRLPSFSCLLSILEKGQPSWDFPLMFTTSTNGTVTS